MGNNQLYTIYEQQVIAAYDARRVGHGQTCEETMAVLRPIMETGRGTDIDHGGCHDLRTYDGKSADQVIIEAWGMMVPRAPTAEDSDDYHERYANTVFTLFSDVSDHEFGWE